MNEAELRKHLVTGVAVVEADFIFYDRLPTPCIVLRLEDLPSRGVHHGDDASEVVPYHLVVAVCGGMLQPAVLTAVIVITVPFY